MTIATPISATAVALEVAPCIKVIAYGAGGMSLENITDNPSILPSLMEKWSTLWIIIIGKVPMAQVEALFQELDIDTVELNDVLDLSGDPRVSLLPKGHLLLTHIFYYGLSAQRQQTSFYLGQKILLSIQTDTNDAEVVVLDDINKNISNIRQNGPDFLLYRLLLLYLSSYTQLIRKIGLNVDEYENRLIINPQEFSVESYFQLRKRLSLLKRNLWTQRDVMTQWVTFNQSSLPAHVISQNQAVLFQQFPGRMSETLGLLDAYMAHCNSLLDIYFSLTSNQMNQIMKTLTIFSAIFLPLSFLAGLWGMNFDYNVSHWNMPELHTHYGYPIACLIMFCIAVGLVSIFYQVGWLQFSRKKILQGVESTSE